MKIKDLPPNTNLGGIRVRTATGVGGYWESQWEKGVWLRKDKKDGHCIPIFVENLADTLEWDVIEE